MTIQWDDRLDLEMLHLREVEGLSMKQVGARLGIGKNAVIGRIGRLRAAQEPGAAGDGTMPARWWRKGLEARR